MPGKMRFNKVIKIGKKMISPDSRAFIIAEVGVNHCGDLRLAKKLIKIAADAGADAVKFQSFNTESLILPNVRKAPYQKRSDKNCSQFEMLKRLELPLERIRELKKYSEKLNIIFLSTPFDEKSLEELGSIGLPAYKISSTDITNLPFLKKVAGKSKPIILSTGMAYMGEIKSALEEIYRTNKRVVLLQCTSNYPAPDDEVNLNVLATFRDSFDILVGYSDHSPGMGAAPYAAALGAKVIEKHFTIDKSLAGPDHKASLDPHELKEFIKEIRKAEGYLGSGLKEPTRSESENRKALQKCLVASRSVKKGERFNKNNVTAKRTGGIGISPVDYRRVYASTARREYKPDEIIRL